MRSKYGKHFLNKKSRKTKQAKQAKKTKKNNKNKTIKYNKKSLGKKRRVLKGGTLINPLYSPVSVIINNLSTSYHNLLGTGHGYDNSDIQQ